MIKIPIEDITRCLQVQPLSDLCKSFYRKFGHIRDWSPDQNECWIKIADATIEKAELERYEA